MQQKRQVIQGNAHFSRYQRARTATHVQRTYGAPLHTRTYSREYTTNGYAKQKLCRNINALVYPETLLQ
jgi:hypothetical protein